MLRRQSGLSHVLPWQCLVLTTVRDLHLTTYKRSSWSGCGGFHSELQSWTVTGLWTIWSVFSAYSLLFKSTPSLMSAFNFFSTATRALPWNSQKPQFWPWQIWLTFLQRRLKNLSKTLLWPVAVRKYLT